MARTVTACTLDLFAGRNGTSMNVTTATILLVAMTAAQVRTWADLVGDPMEGTTPVRGWEVRDSSGSLLGAILPLGHLPGAIHAEWYDPQADDFFPAGETGVPVITQAVSLVVNARRYAVGELPSGRDLLLDPVQPIAQRDLAARWRHCPSWTTAHTVHAQALDRGAC